MNAPFLVFTPGDPETDEPTGWSALSAAVNLWRGRCLHLFARAEAAVSEALLLLAKDPASNVTLPLMVGARFDELDRVLATKNDPASKAALAALRGARSHDRLRVFLCHGVATVLSDRTGSWHVLLELIAFRNGVEARDELFLTSGKAMARYSTLNADSNRLCQKLAALAAG